MFLLRNIPDTTLAGVMLWLIRYFTNQYGFYLKTVNAYLDDILRTYNQLPERFF